MTTHAGWRVSSSVGGAALSAHYVTYNDGSIFMGLCGKRGTRTKESADPARIAEAAKCKRCLALVGRDGSWAAVSPDDKAHPAIKILKLYVRIKHLSPPGSFRAWEAKDENKPGAEPGVEP